MDAENIKKLSEYFAERPGISMAFVFGSHAKQKNLSPLSDWDIGIYFWPHEKGVVEWEEDQSYEGEDKVWGDLERILQGEVDLVVLNRAPASLAYTILTEGTPLVIKDRALFLKYLLVVGAEAIDFRQHIREMWEIKQRSRSLSDSDRERLLKIADFLDDTLLEFDKFSRVTWEDYSKNPDVRRNIERWIETIINASLDIAKVLLAAFHKKIPSTYREELLELITVDGFDKKLVEGLAKFVKLRNILAHEYLDLRWKDIQEFLSEAKPHYTALLNCTKVLLT